MKDIKVVISGAGAAGVATAKILKVSKLVLLDSQGPISKNRKGLNKYKKRIACLPHYQNGLSLDKVFEDADVFIGLSGKGKLSEDQIKKMNSDPIIFALSNPTPEIHPEEAKSAGAAIVATGRSDFPNQINNVLAFPGIFRGAIDARAPRITEKMKLVAAETLASLVKTPNKNKILPSPLEKSVVRKIATSVSKITNDK